WSFDGWLGCGASRVTTRPCEHPPTREPSSEHRQNGSVQTLRRSRILNQNYSQNPRPTATARHNATPPTAQPEPPRSNPSKDQARSPTPKACFTHSPHTCPTARCTDNRAS